MFQRAGVLYTLARQYESENPAEHKAFHQMLAEYAIETPSHLEEMRQDGSLERPTQPKQGQAVAGKKAKKEVIICIFSQNFSCFGFRIF